MYRFIPTTLLYVLLLFFFSIIPLFDLLSPGFPQTHDWQDHIARIANFYKNLEEGTLIPRWGANLNYGYGHPVLMFLYPLPSYTASFFHFLGFSLVDSTKIVFALAFIASGYTMFLWARTFLPYSAAFLTALLYLYAPYRFIDFYVRGAIGEHVAFVFAPLVLYALKKIVEERSYPYLVLGVFAVAGLLLSHNAISLMFLPVFVLYALYLFLQKKKHRKQIVFSFVSIFILGFGVAVFFWVPAFFEGKYTLRDIVTGDVYKDRFVPFGEFLYGAWNYGITGQFTTQMGIVHWVGVLASVVLAIYLFFKKNRVWIPISLLLVCFFVTLFLMLDKSLFLWEKITILQKFQFPWRLLTLSVFFSAVLGGISYAALYKKHKWLERILLLLSIGGIFFFQQSYWQAQSYVQKPESFFTTIYDGTTDTGESSPIWSTRSMEQRPQAPITFIEGEGTIQLLERSTTQHKYRIRADERVRVLENTVYFPGWHVYVDNQEVPVQFQEPKYRGLLTFWVEKGEYVVSVQFRDTKLRMLSTMMSIGSLVLLVGIGLFYKKLWRHFR